MRPACPGRKHLAVASVAIGPGGVAAAVAAPETGTAFAGGADVGHGLVQRLAPSAELHNLRVALQVGLRAAGRRRHCAAGRRIPCRGNAATAFAGSTPKIPSDYQVFQLRQLLFNISRHMLVPKHELINEDNGQSRTQLPIILKTDPMAKYLYAKVGNLVRVTQSDVWDQHCVSVR